MEVLGKHMKNMCNLWVEFSNKMNVKTIKENIEPWPTAQLVEALS